MITRRTTIRFAFALVALAGFVSCRFDRAERWLTDSGSQVTPCDVGTTRCTTAFQRCVDVGGQGTWTVVDDCAANDQVCVASLSGCATCVPAQTRCNGQTIETCTTDGSSWTAGITCDANAGSACRQGSCLNLCDDARLSRSNVGCEYWPVDLDNAKVDEARNAAAQQYAVVVSNPQPDVAAKVRIFQDDSLPGAASQIVDLGEATVPPRSLRVFKLGPREVDGSPDGEFNTGTGTALTRHAFKLTSDFPVVVVQFNPLENVNVFSNDASLLKPVEAIASVNDQGPEYVVVGWPQTIAVTDDPNTNFNPSNPTFLRAFLTLVGTRPDTHVKITTSTKVLAGGPVPLTQPGGVIDATLQPFDVLNLETDGFNADFTGTLIDTDGPVAVFSGSEASDAPTFQSLSFRRCCADHLEEQLDPVRTAGRSFVLAHGPSRGRAVQAAGADLTPIEEPDFFRVVSVSADPIDIVTSLPSPDDRFTLAGIGALHELTAYRDFTLVASGPVHVANISPSQEAVGIPRGLPGGDPSLVVIPPREQWRTDYVFLTPDKYTFDFVTVVVPDQQTATLDGVVVDATWCDAAPADGLTDATRGGAPNPGTVFRCQLSFGVIRSDLQPPDNVQPGLQQDGVHTVEATAPVGVLVSGFDSFVSYGYAAGTDLREIVLF